MPFQVRRGYLYLLSLLILLLASCSTSNNFYRQKYTDFGHCSHNYGNNSTASVLRSSENDATNCEQTANPVFPDTDSSVNRTSQPKPDSLPCFHFTKVSHLRNNQHSGNKEKNIRVIQKSVSPPADRPVLLGPIILLLLLFALLVIILAIIGASQALISWLLIGFVVALLLFILNKVITESFKERNRTIDHSKSEEEQAEKLHTARQNSIALAILAVLVIAIVIGVALLALDPVLVLIPAGIAIVLLLLQRLWLHRMRKNDTAQSASPTLFPKVLNICNYVLLALLSLFAGAWSLFYYQQF